MQKVKQKVNWSKDQIIFSDLIKIHVSLRKEFKSNRSIKDQEDAFEAGYLLALIDLEHQYSNALNFRIAIRLKQISGPAFRQGYQTAVINSAA
jgi:hypothetical protein